MGLHGDVSSISRVILDGVEAFTFYLLTVFLEDINNWYINLVTWLTTSPIPS